MNILDIVKENGGAYTFNLANKEEYEYILNQYGGSSRLEKYPHIKKYLENTKSMHEKGEGLEYKTLLSYKGKSGNGLKDAIYIAYGYYDSTSQKLYYAGVVSLTNKATVINCQIDICDDEGHQVAYKYESVKGTQYKVFSGEKTVPREKLKKGKFLVKMTVDVTGTKKSILNQVVTVREFGLDSPIKQVSISHPIKKSISQQYKTETINVFFGRLPSGGDKDVDYVYEEAYNADKKLAEVTLDIMGSAAFKEKTSEFKAYLDETRAIIDLQKGAFEYANKTEENIIIEADEEDGFYWWFNNDWGGAIPGDVFNASNKSELTVLLSYTIKETDIKQTLIMSSHLQKDLSEGCKKMRQLDLKLGCVAKGTFITMQDGSTKPIEEIKIGDKVMTGVETTLASVEDIWHGQEGTMIVIETMNDQKVIVSGTHPVLTDQGFVEAAKMNAGMQVMTQSQGLVPIRFLYDVDYNDTVYNLDLNVEAGKGSFVGNDIVVGDRKAEVKKELPHITVMSDDEIELYEEFIKLDKELEQG